MSVLQVWPNKGLHYAALAKIAALLGQLSAYSAGVNALRSLQLTHANTGVELELRQLLYDIRGSESQSINNAEA